MTLVRDVLITLSTRSRFSFIVILGDQLLTLVVALYSPVQINVVVVKKKLAILSLILVLRSHGS